MKQGNGTGSRWTETDARRMWSEWRAVGGSLEAFARRNGFGAQRLQWWVKRLGLKDQGAQRGSFVPVVVQGPHVVTYRWVRDSLGLCGDGLIG